MVKEALLAFTVVMVLGGCGREKQGVPRSGEAGPNYGDWQTYTYQNVKFIYPPGYPLADTFEEQAKQYLAAIERNCRFFEMDVPSDTLVVYFYTGYGQGREMTGRQYPFADSSAIHFWLPSFPGVTLMQWLLPRWHSEQPRYLFLKHGLYSLLDYSGQNYHVQTINYADSGRLIPLAELAEDTTVDSDTERYQSALAASFVDFISYHYGIKALEALYLARKPFPEAVEEIFLMPVDSLQRRWLDFARERAGEPRANVGKSQGR